MHPRGAKPLTELPREGLSLFSRSRQVSSRAAAPRNDLHSVARLIIPAVRQPTFARIEERAMGDSSEEARARAEAKFQKQQKAAEEGAKATAEHEAQARAVDVYTVRLKSLWLTKEAADKEAEAKNKPAETSGKTKSTVPKKKPSP
jgi:hypothetical protein